MAAITVTIPIETDYDIGRYMIDEDDENISYHLQGSMMDSTVIVADIFGNDDVMPEPSYYGTVWNQTTEMLGCSGLPEQELNLTELELQGHYDTHNHCCTMSQRIADRVMICNNV